MPKDRKEIEVRPGTLYLVATPIGNLGDISRRAVETLAKVDIVLCEDTRKTGRLFEHLGIKRELSSYYLFNEARKLKWVTGKIEGGASIALVSSAGTPLVCDPGSRLVSACIENGLAVEVIPGPTAFITAMLLSGFTEHGFHFSGWIPRKGREREEALKYISSIHEPVAFYESAKRVAKTLADFAGLQPGRGAIVARELTKLHEEVIRGTCVSLAVELKGRELKGECVVVLGPWKDTIGFDRGKSDMVYSYFAVLKREGIPDGRAAKIVAKLLGLPAKDIYRLLILEDEVE